MVSPILGGFQLPYRSIFLHFMTVREKQILARSIGIQKENWGQTRIF